VIGISNSDFTGFFGDDGVLEMLQRLDAQPLHKGKTSKCSSLGPKSDWEASVHAHRIACRHRYHCHPRRVTFAKPGQSQGGRPPGKLHKQP
jgi:hypothetical protein